MPVSLQGRAADDLRYIRRAMERSGTFTAVPGAGGAAMGSVGLTAALVASTDPDPVRWLTTWLVAAAIACSIGVVAIRRKAARAGLLLSGAIGRRFAVSMAAPLVAGAALTFALVRAGQWPLLPPMWLLLYGAGLVTGGVVSVAIVRVLGLCIMTAGVAASLTPAPLGDLWLGIGFGVMQIVFGVYIWRKHGG